MVSATLFLSINDISEYKMYPVIIVTTSCVHQGPIVLSGLEPGDLEELSNKGFNLSKSGGEETHFPVPAYKIITCLLKKGYDVSGTTTDNGTTVWTLTNKELGRRRGSCITLDVNEGF